MSNELYFCDELNNTFGEYINGLEFKQARIAETEKYAHVTYFFDGGENKKYKLCDKYLKMGVNDQPK